MDRGRTLNRILSN